VCGSCNSLVSGLQGMLCAEMMHLLPKWAAMPYYNQVLSHFRVVVCLRTLVLLHFEYPPSCAV